MSDCDNFVFLGFQGQLDLVQGNDASNIGLQRIYLGAIGLEAVEELIPVQEVT